MSQCRTLSLTPTQRDELLQHRDHGLVLPRRQRHRAAQVFLVARVDRDRAFGLQAAGHELLQQHRTQPGLSQGTA